jgi:hypothetical protein
MNPGNVRLPRGDAAFAAGQHRWTDATLLVEAHARVGMRAVETIETGYKALGESSLPRNVVPGAAASMALG